jgi:hypothetical protein
MKALAFLFLEDKYAGGGGCQMCGQTEKPYCCHRYFINVKHGSQSFGFLSIRNT